MERKFEQTAVVTYHHVSPKGVISQQALLAFLQDLAIGHADSLGYTLAYLAKMRRRAALSYLVFQLPAVAGGSQF